MTDSVISTTVSQISALVGSINSFFKSASDQIHDIATTMKKNKDDSQEYGNPDTDSIEEVTLQKEHFIICEKLRRSNMIDDFIKENSKYLPTQL